MMSLLPANLENSILNVISLGKKDGPNRLESNLDHKTTDPERLESNLDHKTIDKEKDPTEKKHPFLGYNPKAPNNGKLVTKIEELEDKKVNYKELLISSGTLPPPQKVNVISGTSGSSGFSINFDLLSEEIKKMLSSTIATNDTVSLIINSNEIDQSWTLLDIITKKPIRSWINVFNESYNDMVRINNFLIDIESQGKQWYPFKKDLFRSFILTPLESVKVVIVGQDPYPGIDKKTGLPFACGLSFSTSRTSGTIPDSLKNIFAQLRKTVKDWFYNSSDLSCWAEQGVLLLNKCLTVDSKLPGSHRDLWSEFITRVINNIDKVNPKCIYVLWGNHAQELSKTISSKNILMSSHPGNRGKRFGFVDCDHFNEINVLLKGMDKKEIDWNVY